MKVCDAKSALCGIAHAILPLMLGCAAIMLVGGMGYQFGKADTPSSQIHGEAHRQLPMVQPVSPVQRMHADSMPVVRFSGTQPPARTWNF